MTENDSLCRSRASKPEELVDMKMDVAAAKPPCGGSVGNGWFASFGQGFNPLLIPGLLFALSGTLYVRAVLTFYTPGTFGYALATVLNDVVVPYSLYAGR